VADAAFPRLTRRSRGIHRIFKTVGRVVAAVTKRINFLQKFAGKPSSEGVRPLPVAGDEGPPTMRMAKDEFSRWPDAISLAHVRPSWRYPLV
jgi:hypothetical protein